jgi:HJR/Mrr/RecB family endonuclease
MALSGHDPKADLEQDRKWFAEKLGCKTESASAATYDLNDLDVMEPMAFERWAKSRCAPLGWEVSRTPRSHDAGADGLLVHRNTGARAIVQCKHKQSDEAVCGQNAVDDLLRARAQYAVDARLIAITNAKIFSKVAQEQAMKHGIVLVDRDALREWPQQLS